MDSEEKKPKRPRIGENRIAASSDGDAQHYGKVNYDQPSDYQSSGEHTQGDYQRERNYQPRPYNNNRQQGGYGNNRYNQGGYRQGNNYNNRYNQEVISLVNNINRLRHRRAPKALHPPKALR